LQQDKAHDLSIYKGFLLHSFVEAQYRQFLSKSDFLLHLAKGAFVGAAVGALVGAAVGAVVELFDGMAYPLAQHDY